jgi:hypothetical protein
VSTLRVPFKTVIIVLPEDDENTSLWTMVFKLWILCSGNKQHPQTNLPWHKLVVYRRNAYWSKAYVSDCACYMNRTYTNVTK